MQCPPRTQQLKAAYLTSVTFEYFKRARIVGKLPGLIFNHRALDAYSVLVLKVAFCLVLHFEGRTTFLNDLLMILLQ